MRPLRGGGTLTLPVFSALELVYRRGATKSHLNKSTTTAKIADRGVARAENVPTPTSHLQGRSSSPLADSELITAVLYGNLIPLGV